MNAYINAFQNYVNFSGTTNRRDFWLFFAVNLIVAIAIAFISEIIQFDLVLLYWFVALLPTAAITVRRVRDSGLSGWWALACLTPIVGGLVWLYFGLRSSAPPTPAQAVAA